ncbi:MAG: nuclear transport factor 2 family protein [Clostridiales bacterium]|nr:nuclear transport factor 2 family protein [Clostridiales bacterium]MDD6935390.1 hypothetical protein [Clostridiales bacterium]MDY2961854.1 hypothetical protein [Oscillospiraceae bacterium]
MKKMTNILFGVVLALIVLTVAAVSMNSAIDANAADADAIETVLQQANLLTTDVGVITDRTGALDEGRLEAYRAELAAAFTADSGYREQYGDIMANLVASFDDTTDVVLSNEVVQCNVRSIQVDGDTATAEVGLMTLQRYIPHKESGVYRAIFAVGTETDACTLVRGEDGLWRVRKWEMSDYQFGSPVDMKVASELLEADFATRQEACAYANSLSVEDICPLLK